MLPETPFQGYVNDDGKLNGFPANLSEMRWEEGRKIDLTKKVYKQIYIANK